MRSQNLIRTSIYYSLIFMATAGFMMYISLLFFDSLGLSESKIDPDRIGCMGISGGGTVCTLAAALDDRIKAAVVSGYISTFKESIMAMDHCIEIEAASHAFQKLQTIYNIAGVPNNVDQDAFEGTHEISGNKAYDWFDKL